jgi:hypothetical protein
MVMTVSSDAAHPHVVWTIPNYQYECNGEDELVQNVFIEKSEMTGWLSSDRRCINRLQCNVPGQQSQIKVFRNLKSSELIANTELVA